jgi:hypothetical protein
VRERMKREESERRRRKSLDRGRAGMLVAEASC